MSGFTLIELIMVLVLAGVLAVFVAPRLNVSDFFARGFHDETLALLRYAQKTAIAQRRTVCVAFPASAPASATLTIASAAASSVCDTSLIGPNQSCAGGPTGPRACINAKSSVSYSAGPATMSFDGLGQPLPSATQTIRVANAGVAIPQIITVEAGTGYVHD
jgi:MSHA pilin protein MshC